MSDKETPDWETLNAYVDGELSSEREAWVKDACKDNPNITSEIARLVILKKALASKPMLERQDSALGRQKWKVVGGSAAMAVLLMVFVGMFQLGGGTSSFQMWAMEKHVGLSERSFVVTNLSHNPLIAASVNGAFQAPDLTGSKLYLVDLTIQPFGEKEGIVMHYRGLRGCRVSFLLAPKGADNEVFKEAGMFKEEMISRFWDGNHFRFGLLATGMDENRFNSISTYLKLNGERNLPATKEDQYAMRQVYEASKACV